MRVISEVLARAVLVHVGEHVTEEAPDNAPAGFATGFSTGLDFARWYPELGSALQDEVARGMAYRMGVTLEQVEQGLKGEAGTIVKMLIEAKAVER